MHNDEVTWLASYKETINGGVKYIWLSASSRLKGEADRNKFEKARELKKNIAKIRDDYTKELKDSREEIAQRATALYLIDKLGIYYSEIQLVATLTYLFLTALRVGNEKNVEKEADTVGCCSLRFEHVKCLDNGIVSFNFPGKDSVPYVNDVKLDHQVWLNIKELLKDKAEGDDLFDKLTTTKLNEHLKELMPGLSAKVFRTYNASHTLQILLDKMTKEETASSVPEKMLFFTRANREVAILCNHQRNISKNFDEQMDKVNIQVASLHAQKENLQLALKDKRTNPIPTKTNKKDEQVPAYKIPDSKEKIQAAIQRLDNSIRSWESKQTEKSETKDISLTTSKINYIGKTL